MRIHRALQHRPSSPSASGFPDRATHRAAASSGDPNQWITASRCPPPTLRVAGSSMIRLIRTAASRCRGRGMNNENTQASCWRRATSTIAWSFRLLKKAGMERRRSITSLNRGHIGRCILHGITAQYETESLSGSGLPSVVDRSSAERKRSMIPRWTDIENRQRYGPIRARLTLI